MYTGAITVPNDELVLSQHLCGTYVSSARVCLCLNMYTGAITAPKYERVLSQHLNVMYFSSACLCVSMRTYAILATKNL